MQGIYNYIPETNHVSRVYSVAAVMYLQFVLHVMLFRPWSMFCTQYISGAVPSAVVFCRSLISCFFGMSLRYCTWFILRWLSRSYYYWYNFSIIIIIMFSTDTTNALVTIVLLLLILRNYYDNFCLDTTIVRTTSFAHQTSCIKPSEHITT
jgi:hypothetical protein